MENLYRNIIMGNYELEHSNINTAQLIFFKGYHKYL